MAGTGQVHGHASSLSRLNNFLVADRTARVHDGTHTGVQQHLQAVSEGEERVGCGNRTAGTLVTFTAESVRALHRELAGIHAVHLAHADAHGGTVIGKQNSVGLGRTQCTPRELEVTQGCLVSRLTGNQGPVLRVVTLSLQAVSLLEERRRLAAGAFAHTAAYDTAVATWTASQFLQDEDANFWPPYAGLGFERSETLRYGENPHQRAALYVDPAAAPGIAQAEQVHGKAMSYNNYVDADAALRAAYDFDEPAVAVIKHNNPCGIAVATPGAADPIADAHAKAHACDPLSAYGGVIAANRPVTAAMAQTVKGIFTEVIVAPGFEPEALEILREKKNLRLLVLPEDFAREAIEYRPISGGALFQEADRLQAEGDDPKNWTLVAGEAADEATLRDLEFAWRALRSPKSNAILLADNGAAVGIGMGQVNRVDSCKLSVERANTLGGEGNERARGAVAASDAFFPFADGLQVLLDAGVRAVVHPGGSIRDEEVIEAAKAAGVTMYLTGTRHFFH